MKLSVWKFNILVLCIMMGVLITLQIKSVNGDYLYVPLKTIHDYNITIKSEKKEIENLKNILEERKERYSQYASIKDEGGIMNKSEKTRILRGDIYYADLNPVIGSEQGGVDRV